MRDDELRALARVELLGSDEERAGLLTRLVRAGELSRDELKLRAWLGDPAASAAWEGIGELERPPRLSELADEIRREREAKGRPGEVPTAYLRRRFGRAWANGIAPLGEQAGVRVCLAALRACEARVALSALPRGWEAVSALGKAWEAGERDFGRQCDELELELVGQRGPAVVEVARALLVALGCMSSRGAAESAGGVLSELARVWERELSDPELQRELRQRLVPPPA